MQCLLSLLVLLVILSPGIAIMWYVHILIRDLSYIIREKYGLNH